MSAPPVLTEADRVRGLVVGLVVGDAIALPMEGLSPRRAARLFPGELRHRLVLGRGMGSDDSEHALLTAAALLAHPDDPAAFRRKLAWQLRFWFLGLPAGIGLATLRACLRMWVGLREPGVWSAGNGPGMRAPVIGAAIADAEARQAFVAASSRLTHTDPKATTGALAIAWAADWAVAHGTLPGWLEARQALGECAAPGDADWDRVLGAIGEGLAAGDDVPAFAARLGLQNGVTGYMYHSAPVALFAWLRHGADYRAVLAGVVAAGGDTDSVGAMAGALSGALAGEAGLPAAWVAGVAEWPRGLPVARALADGLARVRQGRAPQPAVPYFWPGLALRNALFTPIVLAHGVRRLLPPY